MENQQNHNNEYNVLYNDVNHKALHPEWNKPDSVRGGQPPTNFKIRNLEFGAKGPNYNPMLEKLGLEELIGADAFESANLKANHIEPGVLTGMLNETMSKIEQKYHSGVYDAAAMPLVEQYLNELKKMAHIQLERQEIISKRVADIKEANEAAYKAVQEVREKREEEIRRRAEYVQDEARLKRYKKSQRIKVRKNSRDNRRMLRDISKLEKAAAKKTKAKIDTEVSSIYNDLQVAEATMNKMRQESANKTELVNDELRRAEARRDAKVAELAGAQAAMSTAEANLARVRTEILENELREEHGYVSNDVDNLASEIQNEYNEQVAAAREEYENLAPQIEAAEKDKHNLSDKFKDSIKNVPNFMSRFKKENKQMESDTNGNTDDINNDKAQDGGVETNSNTSESADNLNKQDTVHNDKPQTDNEQSEPQHARKEQEDTSSQQSETNTSDDQSNIDDNNKSESNDPSSQSS